MATTAATANGFDRRCFQIGQAGCYPQNPKPCQPKLYTRTLSQGSMCPKSIHFGLIALYAKFSIQSWSFRPSITQRWVSSSGGCWRFRGCLPKTLKNPEEEFLRTTLQEPIKPTYKPFHEFDAYPKADEAAYSSYGWNLHGPSNE